MLQATEKKNQEINKYCFSSRIQNFVSSVLELFIYPTRKKKKKKKVRKQTTQVKEQTSRVRQP